MTTQYFNVTFRIAGDKLPTILELLSREKGVTLTRVDVSTTPGEPIDVPLAPRYAGGRRNKGISAEALVLQTAKGGGASMVELERAFTDHGFAISSISPSISNLTKQGRVQRTEIGIRLVRDTNVTLNITKGAQS